MRIAAVGWLGFVLVSLWATPAAADNCAVFTDCFGQSGAFSEAVLGLSLLAGLSLVVDFIPVVGDVKGLIEMGTGRDLFTGEELAPWERSLGLIGLIPGGDLARLIGVGGDLAGGVGRNVDELAALGGGVGGVGRNVDELAAVGGGVGGVGSTTRGIDGIGEAPAAGDVVRHGSHRGDIDQLARDYANATTVAEKKVISETIGELGAVDYLEQVTGRGGLDILRPTSDADVAGLIDDFDAGVGWDQPVAFGGARATNVVYYDGQTLHIVEAKGGAGRYGDRASTLGIGNDKGRISQTEWNYPRDVAADMANSPKADGRNAMGDLIEDAYQDDIVSYTTTRTTGHNAGGPAVTTLEHIVLP